MDQAQALTIVRSLANGVDPESGEVFLRQEGRRRRSARLGNGGARLHQPSRRVPRPVDQATLVALR